MFVDVTGESVAVNDTQEARYFDVGIKFILCLRMSGTSGQQQNSLL